MLGGCGGGGTTPRADPVAAANAICARLNAEVRRLSRPTTVESAVGRPVQLSSDLSETADALDRLARSDGDPRVRTLARGMRHVYDVAFDLATLARQPTPSLVRHVHRELPLTLAPVARAARTLGAARCRPLEAERRQLVARL
jgi:hypothetical protein